jgi:hypothetical protein
MGPRILAIVLRALFIGALVAVTVRVSGPQSESLAAVYETPGDLIRLALGFAVCLLIVIHMFMLPGPPRDIERGSASASWSPRSRGRSPSLSGDADRARRSGNFIQVNENGREVALLGLAVMYRRSADMIHVRRIAEHSTGNGASASGTAEDAS